jgi:GMP synthase (glutamine-hydrolysing)
VMGGPQSANDGGYVEKEKQAIGRHVDAGKPYLGICLGAQLLAKAIGGMVKPGMVELGNSHVTLTTAGKKHASHAGIEGTLNVFQMHNDTFIVPHEYVLAIGNGMQQAFCYNNALGLQFHLEATEQMVQKWVSGMAPHMSELALTGIQEHQKEYQHTLNSVVSYFFGKVGI